MAETRNPDELGALWVKRGAKGDYMTGTIGGEAVVCFRNDFKEGIEARPDWRVLKSRSRDGAERVVERVPPPRQIPDAGLTDDDIPF